MKSIGKPEAGLDALWYSIKEVVEGKRNPVPGDLPPLTHYLINLSKMTNPPTDVVNRIEELINSLQKE